MAYTPFYSGGWKNYPDTSTPITAEALNHMDTGIKNAGEGAGGELFVKTVDSQSGKYWYDIFKCNIGNASAIEQGKGYYYVLRGWCQCKAIDVVAPGADVASATFDFDFPGIDVDIPDATRMWHDWGSYEASVTDYTYWYSSLNYAHLGLTDANGYCEIPNVEPRNCLAGFHMSITSTGTGSLGSYFSCSAKAFLPNFAGVSTFSFSTEDVNNLKMFFELRLEAVRQIGKG